jgi:hypothetical protein
MVSNAFKRLAPYRKQQASEKQGKTQHARYRTPCTQQATSKANPALRQGKPKTVDKASPWCQTPKSKTLRANLKKQKSPKRAFYRCG